MLDGGLQSLQLQFLQLFPAQCLVLRMQVFRFVVHNYFEI